MQCNWLVLHKRTKPELKELGLERGLSSCHGGHHLRQPDNIEQKLVNLVGVRAMLRLHLLKLLTVLLVNASNHVLSRLGGYVVERGRYTLRNRGDGLVLHDAGFTLLPAERWGFSAFKKLYNVKLCYS